MAVHDLVRNLGITGTGVLETRKVTRFYGEFTVNSLCIHSECVFTEYRDPMTIGKKEIIEIISISYLH